MADAEDKPQGRGEKKLTLANMTYDELGKLTYSELSNLTYGDASAQADSDKIDYSGVTEAEPSQNTGIQRRNGFIHTVGNDALRALTSELNNVPLESEDAHRKGNPQPYQTFLPLESFEEEDAALTLAQKNPRADMLLSALLANAGYSFRDGGPCAASTTVNELMELFGWTDKKKAKKTLKNDLAVLGHARIDIETPEDAPMPNGDILNKGTMIIIPISEQVVFDTRSGNIWVSFSRPFVHYMLARATSLQLDENAYKVNTHTYAWTLNRQMADRYRQRMEDDNDNVRCKLSVKSILKFCAHIDVDTYASDNPQRLAIEPMEKAFNELVNKNVIHEWGYCREKDNPLSDEEERRQAEGSMPWNLARKLYVWWDFVNAPDYKKAIESKRGYRLKLEEDEKARKKRADSRRKRQEREEDEKIADARARRKIEEEERQGGSGSLYDKFKK